MKDNGNKRGRSIYHTSADFSYRGGNDFSVEHILTEAAGVKNTLTVVGMVYFHYFIKEKKSENAERRL